MLLMPLAASSSCWNRFSSIFQDLFSTKRYGPGLLETYG